MMQGQQFVLVGSLVVAAATAVGCAGSATGKHGPVTALSAQAQASAEQHGGLATNEREVIGSPTCAPGDVAVSRYEGGSERGKVCAAAAKALGLTVVDLGDEWTPTMFAPSGDQVPTVRASYLATAQSLGNDEEALQELYGVVPSFSVARARLDDDARHACHAAIDAAGGGAAIAKLDHAWSQDDQATVKMNEQVRAALAAGLEKERVRKKLPDTTTLKQYPQWKKLQDIHDGLVAVQQHFACEKFLEDKYADGFVTCGAPATRRSCSSAATS